MKKRRNATQVIKRNAAQVIKRNADDTLRRAERAYKQDPSPATRVSYWKACLRAGKLPEPTHISKYGEREWVVAEEEYEKACNTGATSPVLSSFDMVFVLPRPDRTIIGSYLNGIREELVYAQDVEAEIMRRLRKIVDAQTKKNPDDRLRRLERRALETQDKEDLAVYWKEALRAGEIPKPNLVNVETRDELGDALSLWYRVYEAPAEHYGIGSLGWSLYDCIDAPGTMLVVPRLAFPQTGRESYLYCGENLDVSERYGISSKALSSAITRLLEVY